MLPFQSKMQQNRWRLGLCPRPRWGSLHNTTIVEIHDTLFKIIALDASILVQNAPKSLAALGELTYHWWNPWHYLKSSHQMLPFQSKMQQNRWRLGLRPRPRWGAYIYHWWYPWHITQNHCTRCFHFCTKYTKISGWWAPWTHCILGPSAPSPPLYYLFYALIMPCELVRRHIRVCSSKIGKLLMLATTISQKR